MASQRTTEIYERVLDALRTVVTDLRVTEDELHTAAEFLNKLGASGEFPLLFDIQLAITSCNVIKDHVGSTPACIEGPYYRPDPPERPDGNLIERPLAGDVDRLIVVGQVTDAASGDPISDAEVDVWQADELGDYDFEGYHLRGVVRTDERGEYRFETIVPAPYEIPKDGPTGELMSLIGRHHFRPAHLHYRIRVDGVERLMTQIYFAGGDYLDSDVADAVKDDIILPLNEASASGEGRVFELKCDIALPSAVGILEGIS